MSCKSNTLFEITFYRALQIQHALRNYTLKNPTWAPQATFLHPAAGSGRGCPSLASGSVAATTAPTYGLVHNVATVIEALPPELFDRHAEHRPCGLLCQRGAMDMLIGDVLGLPLLPCGCWQSP